MSFAVCHAPIFRLTLRYVKRHNPYGFITTDCEYALGLIP
jgi:hypothetical protein